VKITVNLDTQAIITQPSPLRFKAGCFNPVELGFTRGSQSVPLPDGAVIEFALKPRNQWTGGLLAYLNAFVPAAGNLYLGTLNCATAALMTALGLSDQVPANDVANLDASAEVSWSFGGQKFRSVTFPATVETPLIGGNAATSPDPELYPAPADVARKSDIPQLPVFGTAASLNAGVSNGVATLGQDGKVPPEQLPAMPHVTSIKVVSVSDAAGRLALTQTQLNVGDLVEQTDTLAVYQVLDATLLNQEAGYVLIGTRSLATTGTLGDGLLAFWKLDEESTVRGDATGNGNALSDTNGVGFTSGKLGNAAYFNGSNSLSTNTTFDTSQSYTICCWAKTDATGGYQKVVEVDGASSQTQLEAWGDGFNGPFFQPANNVQLTIPGFVGDTQPHFLTCAYNAATGVASFYIDGQKSTQDGLMGIGQPGYLGIGGATSDPLTGWVDEVGVWNRALSDEEIAQLYNNGNGLAYPFP